MKELRRELERLRERVRTAPKIWRWRSRRVVPAEEWKYGDWTALPASGSFLIFGFQGAPEGWVEDYHALLEKLEDSYYGKVLCWNCLIHEAERAKAEIERRRTFWKSDAEKEKRYKEFGEPYATEFRREDAFEEVKWRLLNEFGEARDRICKVVNYFRCPYGADRETLVKAGHTLYKLIQHLEWYDRHWNRQRTFQPTESERKCYHWGEPQIVDVTDYDDVVKALSDGRLKRIIAEHARYTRETGEES